MGFINNIREALVKSLQGDIDALTGDETLEKASGDDVPLVEQQVPTDDAIGHRAYLTDPYYDYVSNNTIQKNRYSRISYRSLKDASVRDWVVSAIVQARCDTLLRFARPQRKHLDMGFKIKKKDHLGPLTSEEKKLAEDLEDFILNCGRKEGTPAGEEQMFGEFLKLAVRDALVIGHVTAEKILTRGGALHRFRHVPADSMYLVNNRVPKDFLEQSINNADKTRQDLFNQNTNDPRRLNEFNAPDVDYYKYVQMNQMNQPISAWGDEDMVWSNSNPIGYTELNGYTYSPLELSIINVTRHMGVEAYNSAFFTHGYASRGILHLKGTVTQANLTAFRRQFYNTINGVNNAWRTPIVAGLDEVQWIPISATAKEMEYLNYNNHLMRAICSQFQIDPMELGLDYLVSGNGRAPTNGANNEAKISYSRERGLIPLLMMFEDIVNSHIIPAIDKSFTDIFEFRFTGMDDDNEQVFLANQQAAMTIYSSMNDLLHETGRSTMKHPIADLPLNQNFWGLVEKNMTRGEIREFFLGDKDASKRTELAYIPADPAYLSWQQLLMTIEGQKQAQVQQQQAQQAQDQQAQTEQSQQQQMMDDQKHKDMNEAAANVVHGQTLRDTAKQFGGTAPSHVGGTTLKNPINSLPETSGGGDENPQG